MRYLSLFSGIEAASVAWLPLGWECVAVAEVEPFPCSLLAHHYPGVPNLGDVTAITEEQIAALGRIDVIIGGFPCFPRGTLILCRRGLVDIADVVEGDEVWTHRHRWRKVAKHHGSHLAPTIVMRGHGHPQMVTTENHPFLSSEKTSRSTRSGGKPVRITTTSEARFIDAGNMRGKFWATPGSVDCDRPPAPSFVLDEAAFYWCLGRWLADGWVTAYKRTSTIPKGSRGSRVDSIAKRVMWCCAKHETPELLDRLTAAGIAVCVSPSGAIDRLTVQSGELFEFLVPFKSGAATKTIPSWVIGAPEHLRTAFLDGYLSGDGCAHKDGWKATTVSKAIAVGIRLLAVGLGWSVSMHHTSRPRTCVIDGRTVNQRDTWQLAAYPQSKGCSSFSREGYRFGLVRSVEPTGDTQDVFNFEVEDDNSYVADGLIVHNCQDLSVAGLRKGLKNHDGSATRSGLFYDAMRVAGWARERCGARWLVVENVPGLFSNNGGRDFAAVVGEMAGAEFDVPRGGWRSAGFALGPDGLCEWVTLDAQWFGVPQRRRRVFIVRDSGDWSGRCPLFSDQHRLSGNPPPSRGAGAGVAGPITASAGKRCGVPDAGGTDGHLIATSLTSRMAKGVDSDCTMTLIPVGFNARQDPDSWRDRTGPLDCDGGSQAVAYRVHSAHSSAMTGGGSARVADPVDVARCIDTSGGYADSHGGNVVLHAGYAVRRLTELECERLMGVSDGYTAVPFRGKVAAGGNRYKALGNSFVSHVIAYIGGRIEAASQPGRAARPALTACKGAL